MSRKAEENCEAAIHCYGASRIARGFKLPKVRPSQSTAHAALGALVSDEEEGTQSRVVVLGVIVHQARGVAFLSAKGSVDPEVLPAMSR